VIGRDRAGIAGDHERPRPAQRLQLLPQLGNQGGKAAVEAHHQQGAAALGMGSGMSGLDLLELSKREAEGLFHQAVLARCQGLTDQAGMTVVAGGDHQRIGAVAAHNSRHIGAGFEKAVTASHVNRGSSAAGRNRVQPRPCPGQGRHQGAGRMVPRTDYRYHRRGLLPHRASNHAFGLQAHAALL